MLFSESWLRTYVNPAISSEELQDALTMHGLEVDEARKAAPDFTGVVIAEVVECRDHENSDHLHVCQVNAGTGELIQIVCGAPNVRAGVRVPCAMVGAELPGGFKIKKAKLRGVPSNGMLCSARELGVSEDHDGLWLLPEDAPIGEDIRKYAHLDDVVVDLNVTPNRGDALSLTGIAREVHAVTGAELKLPEIHEAAVTTDAAHAVKIEASDLCARYTSRVITGLNAKAKTPEWMAERLERCGQRPISALVDISNYVLLELGRPTHFFDLDKLSGTVTARWAKKGEKIELLNGKTVDLTPYYGVIADDNGSQAIAGIMGGSADSVSDDTVNLFIESAFFRPAAIQGRARKLNFSSDSSFRFERGVEPASEACRPRLSGTRELLVCRREVGEGFRRRSCPDPSAEPDRLAALRDEDRVRVFELGRVFFQDPTIELDTSVKGVRQPEQFAGLAYGTADPRSGASSPAAWTFDAKGDLERLAFPLTLDFVPKSSWSLHPGRSAGVYLTENGSVSFGELHPRLQQAYDLLCPVVFEIDAEPLLSVPVPGVTSLLCVPEVAARYFVSSAGL